MAFHGFKLSLRNGICGRPVPLVAAFKPIDAELGLGAEGAIGAGHPVEGGLDPLGVEQLVAAADLPEAGARGDQRADLGYVTIGQEVGDQLAAGGGAGCQPLLEAVQRAGDHRDLDPRVERRGEHRHPAAIREPDAADSPRIDRRVCGDKVERPEDVAEVLGHQQPAQELHADEGGGAGVAPPALALAGLRRPKGVRQGAATT